MKEKKEREERKKKERKKIRFFFEWGVGELGLFPPLNMLEAS